MKIARLTGSDRRGPMLLALVFGVVLVLVGVTASALVAIASVRISTTTLSAVVARDASLVELFVNANLRASDLDADGITDLRAQQLSELLGVLVDDSIERIEIRDVDGRIIASDDGSLVGVDAGVPEPMRDALDGNPTADLADPGEPIDASGDLANDGGMVQEFLPIIDQQGRRLAVVGLWRDASRLLASLDATRLEILLVTMAAGLLLAGLLFLTFRAAQARLTRQHRQILDATRRDALTGMLNHGAVVGLLADEIEAARRDGRSIGVALVDVDNFRLFNDTHGHAAADQVLHRVAGLVRGEAGEGHVARYGPDEFLIVHPGTSVAEVEQAVERLRTGLRDESVQFGDSESLPITVSVGICAYPEHAASVTDLLSAAVVGLNEAKASGGDAVRVAQLGEEERVVAGSLDVLQGLVIAVDTKDRYTKRHSEDVARYATFLARLVGLDEEMQHTIQLAGLLHDIGKIGIPDVILRKPSKLTAQEFTMFQQHVALGDAIVRDVPNLEIVRAGIRHHHERWDGEGYLEGLEGDAIPHIARILAVADAFSAMTTTRPYRKALSVTEALKRLGDAAGTQLEEELVVAFIAGIETEADAPLPGEEPTQMWKPELWVA